MPLCSVSASLGLPLVFAMEASVCKTRSAGEPRAFSRKQKTQRLALEIGEAGWI